MCRTSRSTTGGPGYKSTLNQRTDSNITSRNPDFCNKPRTNGHYWSGCPLRKEPITQSISQSLKPNIPRRRLIFSLSDQNKNDTLSNAGPPCAFLPQGVGLSASR